jgi:pimeloyl-ACP methyl ester carboxylesterase
MPFAAVPEGCLYYEESGDDPAPSLVLLHAGSIDCRMWDPNVPALSDEHHVVRYDRRDMGRSTTATHSHLAADDLATLLTMLGVRQPLIIGSSDGARIALEFAACHPGRVRGLVLAGPILPEPAPGPETETAERDLDARLSSRDEAIRQGRVCRAIRLDLEVWAPAHDETDRARLAMLALERPSFFTLRQRMERLLDPPIAEQLSNVHAPTLILAGERDVALAHLAARAIQRAMPSARRVTVERADHFINSSAPEQFNKLVLEFASTASSAARTRSVPRSAR